MNDTQRKIAEIMKEANLEAIAQEVYDHLGGKVADFADAIAMIRMEEIGNNDPRSHEAAKIYRAAESTLIHSILRHVANMTDHAKI